MGYVDAALRQWQMFEQVIFLDHRLEPEAATVIINVDNSSKIYRYEFVIYQKVILLEHEISVSFWYIARSVARIDPVI